MSPQQAGAVTSAVSWDGGRQNTMIWPLMENRWDWHGGDEALFSLRAAIFLLGDAIIKHSVILSDFNHEPGYLSPAVTLSGQVRLTVKYDPCQPNPPPWRRPEFAFRLEVKLKRTKWMWCSNFCLIISIKGIKPIKILFCLIHTQQGVFISL